MCDHSEARRNTARTSSQCLKMHSSNKVKVKRLPWLLETHRMLANSTAAGSVERQRQTQDTGEDSGERGSEEVRTQDDQLPREKETEVTDHVRRPCVWFTLVFNETRRALKC